MTWLFIQKCRKNILPFFNVIQSIFCFRFDPFLFFCWPSSIYYLALVAHFSMDNCWWAYSASFIPQFSYQSTKVLAISFYRPNGNNWIENWQWVNSRHSNNLSKPEQKCPIFCSGDHQISQCEKNCHNCKRESGNYGLKLWLMID